MKIPEAKAVDNEWNKVKNLRTWDVTHDQTVDRSRQTRTASCVFQWALCHVKHAELSQASVPNGCSKVPRFDIHASRFFRVWNENRKKSFSRL